MTFLLIMDVCGMVIMGVSVPVKVKLEFSGCQVFDSDI